IDDWRKRIGFLGNIADEPIGLLACYTAPIEEVIGTTLDACRLRFAPVLAEHGVEMISAVGCLDIGEVCALRAQFHPINIALPARYVHAMHCQLARRRAPEIDGFRIAKAMAVNFGALLRSKANRRIGCNLRRGHRNPGLRTFLWSRRKGSWRLRLERTGI